MKDITVKLRHIAKRPFWAMLPSELEALYAQLVLEVQGQEYSESRVDASLWAVRRGTAKVIGERFVSSSQGGKTAVIPIIGPLDSVNSDVLWFGGTTYESIQSDLEDAVQDSQVTEIILLVDSPGGAVMGLPETSDAIFAAGKIKPVTAIVTGMAASAAYHLTSQANQVVLTPSGEVGSVGVLMLHADLSKMLDQRGINVTAIFAGKYKTEFWPFFPLTEEAKAAAQGTIDSLYQDFLGAIKRGRGKRATAAGIASNFGDGRMLQAKDAIGAGMVDTVSNVREVFQARTARNRVTAQHRARNLGLL